MITYTLWIKRCRGRPDALGLAPELLGSLAELGRRLAAKGLGSA